MHYRNIGRLVVDDSFHRDIVIRLTVKNGTHVLSFKHDLATEPFDIAVLQWPERVANFRERLPGLLDPLRKLIGRSNLSPGQIVQAVNRIERLANGVLEALIEGSGAAANQMQQLADYLKPVFLGLDRPPVVEIIASTADELIWEVPFEFFPIAPDPDDMVLPRDRFERFLGFRAEIVRCLRRGPDHIASSYEGRLPVQIFAFEDNAYRGIKRQLKYLRDNASILSEWPVGLTVPDSSEAVSQFVERLLSLPATSDDRIGCVVHFSCHYSAGAPGVEAALDFGKCEDETDLSITIFDLVGEIPRQRRGRADPVQLPALYFLNACETAASSSRAETLIGFFRKRNAAAIIASEALLPDPLAADFAVKFYEEMLQRRQVSSAIFAARRHLLIQASNPVGLFYTLFGNPMLRLAK